MVPWEGNLTVALGLTRRTKSSIRKCERVNFHGMHHRAATQRSFKMIGGLSVSWRKKHLARAYDDQEKKA